MGAGDEGVHPDRLAGVVVCDSPITAPDPEVDAHRMGAAFGKPRAYTSREEALERFRTVPPQDHYLDYVMADVGYHSLVETDAGWRWKLPTKAFASTAFARASSIPKFTPRVGIPTGWPS